MRHQRVFDAVWAAAHPPLRVRLTQPPDLDQAVSRIDQLRLDARANRDFALSDALRVLLDDLGIEAVDSKVGG